MKPKTTVIHSDNHRGGPLARIALLVLATLLASCNDGTPSAAAERPGAAKELHGEHGEGHGEEHGEGHGHGAEGEVKLSDEELAEFGVEIAVAGPGEIATHLELAGEIVPDPDRLAHVTPPVEGIVKRVRKSIGDKVEAGEIMAVIESRELAEAKGEYLAAAEMFELKDALFMQEESLFAKKISSRQEYLDAKQARAEAQIRLRAAKRKLHALGLSSGYVAALLKNPEHDMARYILRAAIAGTVIDKHVVAGEVVDGQSQLFVVADLRQVWVELVVYQKDLGKLILGQRVEIEAGHGVPPARGEISYISPVVDEKTRTAMARVVLENSKGVYRPGLFVKGRVQAGKVQVPVAVPKEALQVISGRNFVFIADGDGFRPSEVVAGRANDELVEVVSGLKAGQRYAARNTFVLKAQMQKETFGEGHGH